MVQLSETTRTKQSNKQAQQFLVNIKHNGKAVDTYSSNNPDR